MLTVVVPAYNEGERIRETLSQLTSSLRDVEVIVVFDGDDHTPDVVRNYPVKLVVSKERLGKGGAIKEGIRRSQGDLIAFLDADMPVTLQELVEVVSATKGADLVVANRKFVGFPNLRKFLHHAFIVTTKAFFPSLMDFSDFQAGLKVMKSSKALEVLDELVINDWLFDVNLIYSFVRRGYKVVEVPVTWVHKDGGKVSGRVVKTATMMFLSLVKLRTYYSPARWVLRTRLYRRAEAWLQRVLR